MALQRLVVQAATSILRLPAARRRALQIGAQRAVSFVLVYHRVSPEGPSPHEVVPSLSSARFEEQIRALLDLGDVVPASEILQAPASGYGRPRFAITFDDDHVCHVRHVLPILSRLGVTATFFLSGRTLHDLPHYWWTLVEEAVRVEGLARTCERLGLSGTTPAEVASQLESTTDVERLTALLPVLREPVMSAEDIRTLAQAGMTIGFHTLHHQMLTTLSGIALEDAVTRGRQELAEAAGQPVDLIAYPYGRSNRAIAGASQRAGFRAGFASGGHPNTHHSDSHQLGRWDPQQLPASDFAPAVTLRLLRTPTPEAINELAA